MEFRCAVPSTIAASTTCPSPEIRASSRAARIPMTRYVDPPPKSPTRLVGKCGRRLVLAEAEERAGDRDVAQVVAGGPGERARPGPSRSSGRRPGAGCDPGIRPGPRPSRSVVPGRRPSTSTSARSTRSSTVATPSGCLRSSATLGRPRLSRSCDAAGEQLAAGPVDPDHVRAEVGQDHAGVWSGPDAGQLDDLEAAQRSGSPAELDSHAPILPAGAACAPAGWYGSSGRSAAIRRRPMIRAIRGRGPGTGGCAPRGGC